MDNGIEDRKLSDTSKFEHVSEVLTGESTKKELTKKKPEKSRKDDLSRVESSSFNLVSIGKSNCGRWVKFQQNLGEGGYKTVYKGYDTEKGNNVAWCEFKPRHVDTKEKQVEMMKEIEIMVKMDHPNIVTCYDIFDEYLDLRNPLNPVNVKSIILIQELLGEGTLKSVIKKNFINGELILEFSLILHWLHQIIDAMSYMHEKLNPPIIHRDLKADNCFLESKSSDKCLNVKVGDFGLAKQVDKKEKNTMLGTVGFMAPEVYDEKYDVKVDIYAFGMLMLEVITNRTPYDNCETVMQVAKETMSGKLPAIFSLVSDQWTREVISCCIHPLPGFRPTAMELYYHPIFLIAYNSESKNILPVEITPNSDKCTDRETIINNFVANMATENGDYNTKFNLRMEFRNKRIQKSFDLDEGESLEFDLDVFKQEDIPELIANLKSEYEENLREVLISNKNVEDKMVNTQLEKFFKSMELQMNFLMKMLLGKRWHFLLSNLLSKLNDPELKDDITGFSLLACYKKNWQKASKLLDNEILNYQKLEKNIDNVKISRVFKASENAKLDSISVTQADNLQFETNTDTDQMDKILEPNGAQKMMKEDFEFNNYQFPSYNNIVSNQPIVYPYNCLPCMNPQQFPGETSHYGWQMYNSGQPHVNNCYTNVDNYDEPEIRASNITKPDSISKTSTKTKKNSFSENHTPCRNDKDSFMDRIFTFDEIMKFVLSKSHRNSRNPFIIIPVRGQSNAFRLIKINDTKSNDNKREESRTPKDTMHHDSKIKSIHVPKSESDLKLDYFNQYSPTHITGSPMIQNTSPMGNMPFEMFPQQSGFRKTTSNASSEPTSTNPQYQMMQTWIQQQQFFQQQFFQQQLQQLILQQQQQQMQQYQHLQHMIQQQHQIFMQKITMPEKIIELNEGTNYQLGTSSFTETQGKCPDQKNDKNEEINSKKTDGSLAKFVVKKCEEPPIPQMPPSNPVPDTVLSIDIQNISPENPKEKSIKERSVKEKSNKEKIPKSRKEKKTNDKTNDKANDNETKENHCNLEPLNVITENTAFKSINSQGEHNINKCQSKSDLERFILFFKNQLTSSGSQTFGLPTNNAKEQLETTNTATSTSELFKSLSLVTPVNILQKPNNDAVKENDNKKSDLNEINQKGNDKIRDLNRSSTCDFTYSQSAS